MRKDGKSTYQAMQDKLKDMKNLISRCTKLMDTAVENYEKIINSKPMILNISEYGEIWQTLTQLKLHLKELELKNHEKDNN